MRFAAICLSLLLSAFTCYAGTEALTTPFASGSLFAVSSEDVAVAQLKSPGRAFLMSLVAPGSGQLYVGKKRGIAQLVAEVGLIAAYFVVHGDAQSIEDDYVDAVKAGVEFDINDPTYEEYMRNLPVPGDPFSGWIMEDFEHATQTSNWHYVYTEESGQPVARVGPFYWTDLPVNFQTASREELKNADIDSQARQEAYDIRDDANSRFKTATTILGVTIANHLVAAIDARIAAKRHNMRSETPTFSLKTRFHNNQLESALVMQKHF